LFLQAVRAGGQVMPNDDRKRSLRESLESFQATVQRAGPAATISYSLIGAIGVLGGLGYGLDRWLGTWPWGLVGGLLFGVVTGLYLLAKEVWRR
jgi:F0F1-type ATP synthase assembly protein I